ncbi:NTP transferase domain-containing protein [bacterium]|nr:NTP transferase domain-containing protein [bacterium]
MSTFVSAIVLAAGMSRRMGTLKQLAMIGDQTLLETTLRAVADSRVHETILVLGYQAEEISRAVSISASTKIVTNDFFEKGMSTSIRCGLRSVSSDCSAALIVLADQPFIKPSIIDALIQEYEGSGAAILVPVYKGFRGNPVLIGRSLFPEMTQLTGDIGCRSLFGLHPDEIRKVQVDDIGVLIDIDTVEDLSKLEAMKTANSQEVLGDLQVSDRSFETKRRHLLIVGGDQIALALAKLGSLLKFRVTLIDPLMKKEEVVEADQIINELDLTKADVTAETYVVVASRGRFDEEALQQAVATPAPYIALMGSKKRGAELIQRLRSDGVSGDALKRIYSPAGLEIHASSPEEIALSIIAQMIQFDRLRA